MTAGGAGALRHDGALARPQRSDWLRRRAANSDFVVDLGRDIGSASWWRGFITVALLCGATATVGISLGVPVIVQPVPRAFAPTQAQEASALAFAPLASGSATGRRIAPTAFVRPLTETPERPRIEINATLGGDFASSLRRAGVSDGEAKTIADMIAGATNGSVKKGTALDIVLGRRPSRQVPRPLEALAFRAAFDLKLEVNRLDGALQVKRIPIAVDDTPLRVTGTVGPSLYKSARAAGVPASVVADVIKALSYNLDFQRDVGSSNRFDIIVEHRRAETGETETGKLLFAGLDQGKKKTQMLRWTLGGRDQFFDASGEATQKGLMRTPVDGARLTSGFGMRRHPLLGYSRMHRGVDFGAAHGTPILAAAAGVINFSGWHGGHGNYIRINHGSGLQTAYGHMSRIAAKSGQRVSQGQVIGYVGSTGMSTGAHLHYELWRNGKAIDPRSVKFTSRTQLAGPDLNRFKARLNSLLAIQPGNHAMTAAKTPEKTEQTASAKTAKPAG
jgi:murein DD-endopeptidase MepM/ murein hydrolase activator NlpD